MPSPVFQEQPGLHVYYDYLETFQSGIWPQLYCQAQFSPSFSVPDDVSFQGILSGSIVKDKLLIGNLSL